MQKYLSIISKSSLFNNISNEDLPSLLKCLNATVKSYKKDTEIISSGSKPTHIGLVLVGNINIVQEDYKGNRYILSSIAGGELFCESFACAKMAAIPIAVQARDNCAVMFLDCDLVLTSCSSSCSFHTQIINNLMKIIANKNVFLTRRISQITKKTIKEKVLAYLSESAFIANNNSFSIPFNRQELADYLSVERSALSYNLCKLRDEKIIKFNKNNFTLINLQDNIPE